MKEFISDTAFSLGFSKIGFAKAEPLNKEFRQFEKWTKLSYNADMAWIERNPQKRLDPVNIMPEVKSVIVTATNYYTADKYHDIKTLGKISRYAWGDDYHDIILKNLKSLSYALEEKYPNSKTRPYVDTGPVLERAWAQKAGLGWIGKNGMLITREYGSWVFLGVIFTDLEIEPDLPGNNLCGKCTDCISECPTDAIIEPGLVDSNKCISYHTIESREDTFPVNISSNLNSWLFGCDICQDVCPWNRFSVPLKQSKFSPSSELLVFSKPDWEELTSEVFNRIFKKSAVKRTKYIGLKRNIEFVKTS